MRKEPTMPERVATLNSFGECDGFEEYLRSQGEMTEQIEALLKQRRAELSKR